MKFRVTMKDPDGAYESFQEAAESSVSEMPLDDEERKAVGELRLEKIKEFAGRWMEYGEYLTVEFDTDAGTCVVVEKGS